MTTYVLVPGMHTGGWVWDAVGARLRESGAAVHAVTPAGAGLAAVELETHVEQVARLLDEVDGRDVVLVAHGYGVLPMLGAAARRPDRVARLVYVDTPPPGEGTTAAGLLPGVDVPEDGGPLPPPAPEDWARLGSTSGVPEEALARLSCRARAQPYATLTRPLRLGGPLPEVPTTGVLCTANGAGVAAVQALVDMGDPGLRALARPDVGFFELDTGHWPMLSTPGALADVLLRAARDEGRRLTVPDGDLPPHLRPFLLEVSERPRERDGRVDLYPPDAGTPRPGVLFVHGGPVPQGARPTPRDWPALVGYARYAAELGAVGATVDHGLHDVADYARAAEDVAAAVARVRADPRVDGSRVALWFFSGGGLLAADRLAAPAPWLRCVAATYPVLAPLPNWGLAGSRFRPADAVRGAGRLPLVLTRVERERPEIAATVAAFVTAARECGADLEVIDVPGGHHGFETVDHTEEARRAVRHAMRSVLGHLGLRC
ncbi:alpha/beta hydrolase [Streptomyces sp. DSM 42041]|uniref:Alpha/beta hydrolase n=1 Tax=Streptomyces hazeniae TaxID=3075538 RepID=A0ABU2NUG8_9ACTN|nr:alpha/beta fold hydrolase [Streptomyces sp. DSM 42041]MDT0380404.1 alpha/beta hydrolase [Streptomyces sp. DSM 42041]